MNLWRAWRGWDGIVLALLVLGAVLSARAAWADMFSVGWHDPEQSHVLLAIPVALWLAFVRRARLTAAPPAWSLWGPAVMLVGWGAGELGLSQSMDVLWHASAVLLVIGALLTVTGPALLLRFAAPLVALAALLPIPGGIRQEIAQPLQQVSAACAAYVLDAVGVPVLRTGNALVVNGQMVVVAEACNGMRMVAALGLVSYAFAFWIPARWPVRAGILALSPVLAVVVNILRLMPTVLFYGYADPGLADLFHSVSGWLMMVLALGVLWSMMQLLKWMELPVVSYGGMRD
jgi:exosortase